MAAQLEAKGEKCYRFQRVDAYDGGIGAFATRDIKQGELILREKAICTTTLASLDRVEASLDATARKRLFSLCDWRATAAGAPKTALGIFQANGYPAPASAGGDEAGVFLNFSRFNHSCRPNVSHTWHAFAEKCVFAARDVAAGEELSNNYVELCEPGAARRATLADRFGFACACVACTAPDEAASDARRTQLAALDDECYQLCRRGRHAKAVQVAERRLALLAEEGLDAPAALLRTCHDAYQAMDHAGDVEGAALWLRRVLAHSRRVEPPDSPEIARLEAQLAKLAC